MDDRRGESVAPAHVPEESAARHRHARLRIDVFTIFSDYFSSPLGVSLLGRARAAGLIDVRLHDPRAWTTDRHRSVDDTPFGGGAGMVMTPEPLFAAVEAVSPPRPLLLLSAAGRPFDQEGAHALADGGGFSLVCGRYEGVDERVAVHLCDGELTVGDAVLAGGEAAALVVIEAVARLVPDVMGNAESAEEESFGAGLLEYPQYTRPAVFRGWEVPDVLRSGDHAAVARWRRAQALGRTRDRRPDLWRARRVTPQEQGLLDRLAPPREAAARDLPAPSGGGSDERDFGAGGPAD